MEVYGNLHGNSGITGYEIGRKSIRLQFRDGEDYHYTYTSAGKEIVEKMKELALAGKGLATFLNQNASEKYVK